MADNKQESILQIKTSNGTEFVVSFDFGSDIEVSEDGQWTLPVTVLPVDPKIEADDYKDEVMALIHTLLEEEAMKDGVEQSNS